MTLQLSVAVRNAKANVFEATVGASPRLQIRSGPQPADCAAADAGTLLAEILLPADWLTAASGGQVAMNGSWTGSAIAPGVAGHFRIKDSAGATTHAQGSISTVGDGGDMTVNSVNVAAGQPIVVYSYTTTEGNA